MFKLKPGNVFQKINKMNRKQAYTWGAIVVVCFIALITLASFMGDADDTSFEGLDARGYDLAQMPFVNDEAEQYLLASKYPDMQNNNATVLFSAEEKAARQEEDAAAEAEEASSQENEDSYTPSARTGRGGRTSSGSSGYGGYSGGRGGRGGATQVGQLSTASMGHPTGGGGISSTFGAPRGDFSPYKSQEKGKETPAQLKNQDARKALYQFARTSQAADGLRDGKGANAKRALMGGNIQGSEAFGDKGVDLEKLGGLALDTNAPITSSDFSNLAKDVADAANKAEKEKKEEEKDFWTKLGESLMEGLADIAMQGIGRMVNNGVDELFNMRAGNSAGREYAANYLSGCTPSDAGCQSFAQNLLGANSQEYANWMAGNGTLNQYITPRQAGRYMRKNGDSGYMEAWHSAHDKNREYSYNVGATVSCPSGQKYNSSTKKCEDK